MVSFMIGVVVGAVGVFYVKQTVEKLWKKYK